MNLLVAIDKYISSGVPSNAAWDLLKFAYERATDKTWEELYFEAFQAAFDESKEHFRQFANHGHLALDSQSISRALHHDLGVSINRMPYSELSSNEFAAKLASVLAARSALVIGGHALSEAHYLILVNNLIRQANAQFKKAIQENEKAFRAALLDETIVNASTLKEIKTFLTDRLNLTLDRLDVLEQRIQALSLPFPGFPTTVTALRKLTEIQVKTEIRRAIGNKYVPSLYVERGIRAKFESFLDKDVAEGDRYAKQMKTAAIELTWSMKDYRARIIDGAMRHRRELHEPEVRRIHEVEQVIQSIRSLRPIIDVLLELFGSSQPDIGQIQQILQEIKKHPGCIEGIQQNTAQLDYFLRNCLIVTDAAGRGKTNLVCALANQRVLAQPTILIAAGMLPVNNSMAIEEYILRALGIAANQSLVSVMDHLLSFIEEAQTELVLIIDALNENSNTKVLRRALKSFLSLYSHRAVKLIVTCRDLYWRGFLHDEGDFWGEYAYDHIHLGDFTDEEFKTVLPLYLQSFQLVVDLSSTAVAQLKHPLLLRFFCESFHEDGKWTYLGEVRHIHLKRLFDTFWYRKLAAVKESLGIRTVRTVQRYLLNIAGEMRLQSDRSLSRKQIRAISVDADLETTKSLYVRILDESIILEQTPSGGGQRHTPRITFVYDEFMEYVVARELLDHLLSFSAPRELKAEFAIVLDSADKFKSIFGALGYLLPMLETEAELRAWELVLQRGEQWHSALCRGLHNALPRTFSSAALSVATQLAASKELEVRIEVAELAVKLEREHPEQAIQLWDRLLYDPVRQNRVRARDSLIMLRREGFAAAEVSLFNALNHEDYVISGTSLFGLVELKLLTPAQLETFLAKADSCLRQAALYGVDLQFESVPRTWFTDVLRKGLRDAEASVRLFSAEIIYRRECRELENDLLLAIDRESDRFTKGRMIEAAAAIAPDALDAFLSSMSIDGLPETTHFVFY